MQAYSINGFFKYYLHDSLCLMAFKHTRKPTESQDPSLPVRDTESDPCWGWLDLVCETMNMLRS